METMAIVEQVETDAYLMLYEIRRRSHMYEDGIPLLDDLVGTARHRPYFLGNRPSELYERHPIRFIARCLCGECLSSMLTS